MQNKIQFSPQNRAVLDAVVDKQKSSMVSPNNPIAADGLSFHHWIHYLKSQNSDVEDRLTQKRLRLREVQCQYGDRFRHR